MQMQAKLSTGDRCVRFLLVTSGNLSAPADNLRKASTVHVRVDFLKQLTFLSSNTEQTGQNKY